MGKLAFWVVVAVVAWFAWQAWRRAERAQLRAQRSEDADRSTAPEQLAESILRCGHCGLHVPASEALRDADAVYCSPAHRDAARRAASR